MNRVIGAIRMQTRSRLVWFFIPWSIVMSSFAITMLVGLLLGSKITFYSGGLSSLYIFTLTLGLVNLNDTFPFALGFGVRRKDYVLSTILLVVGISALNALVILILSTLEQASAGWGLGVHFFYLPYINDGSLIEQFWVYFVPLVHVYFLGFVIGSVYRRFGKTGMFVFFILAFIFITIATFAFTYFRWWLASFSWLSQYSAFELTLGLLPGLAVYLLVSYVLLRKAVT